MLRMPGKESGSFKSSLSHFVSSLLPTMFLVCKFHEYKRQQQEQSRRKVTERELSNLNHKIVSGLLVSLACCERVPRVVSAIEYRDKRRVARPVSCRDALGLRRAFRQVLNLETFIILPAANRRHLWGDRRARFSSSHPSIFDASVLGSRRAVERGANLELLCLTRRRRPKTRKAFLGADGAFRQSARDMRFESSVCQRLSLKAPFAFALRDDWRSMGLRRSSRARLVSRSDLRK